jgi:MoaA/NifB/PqqE/SkfB family radical SAM enzyme
MQPAVYDWLLAHGEQVLTGDSFFHLSAYGQPLPGLNLCGAGRVVCLIDPVGDVYACPFAIHEEFLAGNVREPGGVHRGLAPVGSVRGAAPPALGGRLLQLQPV